MIFYTNSKPKKKLPNNEWQIQEAKAMLSEVVKLALSEPQIITVHNKKTAVVFSYEEYREINTPKQSLFGFFQNSPLFGIDLELPERLIEETRKIDL
jgi:prevent-host-death family protein